MSLGCKFMEFVKRSFNWWKPVKYIVHHFPTREHASYYVSYLAQSWQPFLATKDLWCECLINTSHGRTELNGKRSAGVFSNHGKEKKKASEVSGKKKETQNRLNIQNRTLLWLQSHAAKNKGFLKIFCGTDLLLDKNSVQTFFQC